MRIAICLKGLAAGASKGDVPVIGFKGWDSIVKHVCQDHEYDVFAHSWSVSEKSNIEKTYKPKSLIVEDQKIFSDTYIIGMEKPRNAKQKKSLWAPHLIKSHLYTIKKSVELKKEYEVKNNFIYDACFIIRYDSHYWGDVDYDFMLSDLNKIVYSNHGPRCANIKHQSWYGGLKIWDIWFGGSSKAIDTVAKCYDFASRLKESDLLSTHRVWSEYFRSINYDINLLKPHPEWISDLTRELK